MIHFACSFVYKKSLSHDAMRKSAHGRECLWRRSELAPSVAIDAPHAGIVADERGANQVKPAAGQKQEGSWLFILLKNCACLPCKNGTRGITSGKSSLDFRVDFAYRYTAIKRGEQRPPELSFAGLEQAPNVPDYKPPSLRRIINNEVCKAFRTHNRSRSGLRRLRQEEQIGSQRQRGQHREHDRDHHQY
jgi:hypothetical protein